MKREFLQNFKVGDQPLPKEVIDAIKLKKTAELKEFHGLLVRVSRFELEAS